MAVDLNIAEAVSYCESVAVYNKVEYVESWTTLVPAYFATIGTEQHIKTYCYSILINRQSGSHSGTN